MMTDSEKQQINRFLGTHGLGQVSDPGLIKQIGFLAGQVIKDHEDLKRWLNTCEPPNRNDMLEALRPYLRFKPKTLDVYEAELGMFAEAQQLPVITEDGKLRAFNPANVEAPTLSDEIRPANPTTGKTDLQLANDVIREATAKKHLWLVCGQCTREGTFHGWDQQACVSQARAAGWRYNFTLKQEHCPTCTKVTPIA